MRVILLLFINYIRSFISRILITHAHSDFIYRYSQRSSLLPRYEQATGSVEIFLIHIPVICGDAGLSTRWHTIIYLVGQIHRYTTIFVNLPCRRVYLLIGVADESFFGLDSVPSPSWLIARFNTRATQSKNSEYRLTTHYHHSLDSCAARCY